MEKIPNRTIAGQLLADALKKYSNHPQVLILALPRGGVPVAYEISRDLHVPFDVFLVRKLGVPYQQELAMGAIAMGGVTILNSDVIQQSGVSEEEIARVTHKEEQELIRRNQRYRNNKLLPEVKNKIIILVDDGLATGATMRVAITALKKMQPAKIIIAVPVAPKDTLDELKKLVDEVVCLLTPAPFFSISLWYEEFPQTSDEEVCELLGMES